MVGKLSDDSRMSASRIPVLYCWKYADGHPYSTPNDELRRSIAAAAGESVRGDIGEPGIVGNLLEPALVSSVSDALGIPQSSMSPEEGLHLRANQDGSFQASLDGLSVCETPVTVSASDLVEIEGGEGSITLSGPIPIECKVTSDFKRDDIPLTRGPIQLQAQMMTVGAEFGIIVTLYRGIERQIKIYRADPVIQGRIVEVCNEFQGRVESESFYPPVDVDDAVKTYQSAEGQIDLPAAEGKVERLDTLRQQQKALDTSINDLQTEIMNEMQEAETARCGGYLVTWPIRNYKAQPEKVMPAKDARQVRIKSLQIKRV